MGQITSERLVGRQLRPRLPAPAPLYTPQQLVGVDGEMHAHPVHGGEDHRKARERMLQNALGANTTSGPHTAGGAPDPRGPTRETCGNESAMRGRRGPAKNRAGVTCTRARCASSCPSPFFTRWYMCDSSATLSSFSVIVKKKKTTWA